MLDFLNLEWLIEHFIDAIYSLLIGGIIHFIYTFLCNHTNLFKKNILCLTFEAI